MYKVPSKIYYDNKTGEILVITSEMWGAVEIMSPAQDLMNYDNLKNRNPQDIDFIELEFGTYSETFENCKSYSIDLKTNKLSIVYFSKEELQERENKLKQIEELTERVLSISNYLSDQTSDTVAGVENYILQNELNKLIEGMELQ